jgi:hypothetical protein
MFGSFSDEALNKASELLYGEFPGKPTAAPKAGQRQKWKVQEDGTVVPAEPEQKPKAPAPKGEAPDAANAAVGNAQRKKTGQKAGLAAAAAKQVSAGGKAGVQSQISKLNAGG